LCKIGGIDRVKNHGYIQRELGEKGGDTRPHGPQRMRPLRIDRQNVGSILSSVKSSRPSKTLDIIGFVVIFKLSSLVDFGCWWRRIIRFSREDFFGRKQFGVNFNNFKGVMRNLVLASVLVFFLLASSAPAGEKKTAHNFILKNLEGQQVELEKLYGVGPIYISFWATWCKPCVEELLIMQKLYERHKDKGFLLLAINEDKAKGLSKVKSFVKGKGFSFPVLLDPDGDVSRKYRVFALPYSVLLSSGGEIVYTGYGFKPGDESAVEKKIMNLLPEETESQSPH
jgi:cytochrome c biogenesis protein CcmG/thiol:disulfide interchange protein DsbE